MSEKYVKPVFDIQGWMNDEELQWLYTQARRMESVVEIGCWRGRSTHALLSGCPGIVNAVDHWKGSPDERAAGQPHHDAMSQDIYAQFMANVGQFPNLKVFRMESGDAAEQIAEAHIWSLSTRRTGQRTWRATFSCGKVKQRGCCAVTITRWSE